MLDDILEVKYLSKHDLLFGILPVHIVLHLQPDANVLLELNIVTCLAYKVR